MVEPLQHGGQLDFTRHHTTSTLHELSTSMVLFTYTGVIVCLLVYTAFLRLRHNSTTKATMIAHTSANDTPTNRFQMWILLSQWRMTSCTYHQTTVHRWWDSNAYRLEKKAINTANGHQKTDGENQDTQSAISACSYRVIYKHCTIGIMNIDTN